MKQTNLINELSDKQLKKALIQSQMLFLFIALMLSLFLFDSPMNWFDLFKVNYSQMLYYGFIPGIIIVSIDVILMFFLDEKHYDDGGVNNRIFKKRKVSEIFIIALIVAISEEVLFRGVIQSIFGYVFASIFFALVHYRYLKKPVLLISVLLVSFYIGYLFKITGNLLVTITAHFIVDFLLGLFIRYQK